MQQLLRAPGLGVRPGIPLPSSFLVAYSRGVHRSFQDNLKGAYLTEGGELLHPVPQDFLFLGAGFSSPGRPGVGHSVSLFYSVHPAMIGAVRAPCTNSQPRTSTGTWFAWISTGGFLVMWVVHGWSENGAFLTVASFALFPPQGFRVHRHQRGLAMRQNRRKLHSASRSACPIC